MFLTCLMTHYRAGIRLPQSPVRYIHVYCDSTIHTVYLCSFLKRGQWSFCYRVYADSPTSRLVIRCPKNTLHQCPQSFNLTNQGINMVYSLFMRARVNDKKRRYRNSSILPLLFCLFGFLLPRPPRLGFRFHLVSIREKL